jgi:hypothetical protein
VASYVDSIDLSISTIFKYLIAIFNWIGSLVTPTLLSCSNRWSTYMAKKTGYKMRLSRFQPEDFKCLLAVKKHGRLYIQFDTKRELMQYRLRFYRLIDSLEHFMPEDPLSKWVHNVCISYNVEKLGLELTDRTTPTAPTKSVLEALDKVDSGTYSIADAVDEDKSGITAVDDWFQQMKRKEHGKD